MSKLFEPFTINKMELKNRFVRSATFDGCADNKGQVTEKQINIFENLAKGGVGLIVTGITYVHPSGQRRPSQNALDNNDCIPGYKDLTEKVHNHGAKIAVQLFHAGSLASEFMYTLNRKAMAPSVINDGKLITSNCRAITDEDIREIINAFGDAALRARESNFDAVQVQGAHGYLLSQFLSPLTNQRADQWGGNLENRLRIYKEIYSNIRKKVGDDYPVLIKLGVKDGIPHGLKFTEGKKSAQILAECGFNALEISGGLRGRQFEGTEMKPRINHISREAYYRKWSREIKLKSTAPIIIVGGLRTFALIEEIIQNQEADLAALSRPLIRQPNLINEWHNGNRYRATCTSCNGCVKANIRGETLHCALDSD